MEIREVDAADTAGLRRRVLRDGRDQPPLGDEPGMHHLGAYDGNRLVGSGNIRKESQFLSETWWRVRGMATEPGCRGQGVGAAVLAALLDHARSNGGGGVWLNARTTAQPFYERHGFAVQGDGWDDPDIGPHVLMVLGL